jgi:hypothetical protein
MEGKQSAGMGRAEGRSPKVRAVSSWLIVTESGIKGDWSGGWVEVGYGWIPAFAGMTRSAAGFASLYPPYIWISASAGMTDDDAGVRASSSLLLFSQGLGAEKRSVSDGILRVSLR